MKGYHYVGLDVHKKIIAYCVKRIDGTLVDEGKIPASRQGLKLWVQTLPTPWLGAMEATLFTGWIYDFLFPHAKELKVAHPLMLKALVAAKKKNDRKIGKIGTEPFSAKSAIILNNIVRTIHRELDTFL